MNPWIDKRIFPGAYPPTLREMMDMFEPNKLSVLDVENIRLHYAKTLEWWLQRYEENVEAVRAMFDETFVRAWRLYLVGPIAAFLAGNPIVPGAICTHRREERSVDARMSTAITPETYAANTARLTRNWQGGPGPLRLKKSTISNLFRYQPRGAAARRLSLGEFNHVLGIDKATHTVEVEGLTTYETVVRYCLEHGFLPLVAPELKHITVGGATVGIGIESTSYRYGFVHDGLREADVLLPEGTIVTARADNERQDLFDALPNSYGTLGYILRATIALHRAGPYVICTSRNSAKLRRISRRCASRRSRRIYSSSKACSSRTTAFS